MSLLFQFLAFLSAAYVATQLVPGGLKKLIHVDDFLPTFKSLFGEKAGSFVQTIVGFTESFMPIFLMVGIALLDTAWIVAAAAPILVVMFGAAVVHAFVWKDSPLKPLLIFAATCITLVFAGLM